MPRKKSSASPGPHGGGNGSGKGYRGHGSERSFHPEHGPRLNEDVCISEEVKIGINLAVERFRQNEDVTELEFPSSLTATERAYVHRLCDQLEFKHKSTGKGSGRQITIKKKPASSLASCKSGTFQLVRNSRYQITNLLQRFPVSSRERLELLANTDKSLVNEVSKELARTATGRLNNGVAQVPPPRVPSELQAWTQCLPINQYRDLILHTMNNNQICLISGETGSGKTTQVPQMILDDCYATTRPCRIFCTQPRRIAALSISERVAAERSEPVGQTVGFQIRLESRVSPKTLLTFCTNGVLLRTLMGNDAALSTVTHVIVDEIHERDRFCDFLLLNLRELTQKNPHLKVILMSATMNTDLFSQYFGGCPVVTVPGNLFPVEQFFLEDVLKRTGHTTRKMEEFKRSRISASQEEVRGCEALDTWFNSPMSTEPVVSRNDSGGKNGDSTMPDLTHMSMADSSGSAGGESETREEVEAWVVKEMDEGLAETFLTGSEESFSQVLHLIMSENISVDYQHSVTTITPLMAASGRGFTSHVEQLLSVGADPALKAANGLTAMDFARKFQHEDIVAMLEATMLATERQQSGEDDGEEEDEELESLTEEDRLRLLCYQHCWNDDKVDINLITSLLYHIVSTQKEGAVLIFLPGYDEIVSLRDRIDDDPRFGSSRYSLFLLHSSMQSTDQKKVFRPAPSGVRKIILATNIAETSITINDVVFVIDSGKVKVKSFDALLQSTMLRSYWISKASSAQRKGRAGRVQAGVCFHMFSRVRYSHMSEYETPEILRTPLQELCLQTKLLAPVAESIQEYLNKAPEPPPYLEMKSAITVLEQMDALDSTEELTELGRHLADLPIEPHLGKMVLNSIVLKCLDPVLTIVCSLSYKEPFLLPSLSQEKRNVNEIKKNFSASTFSDHMALLRVFQSWQKARTDGWERAFCKKFYVSPAVMEMIVGIRAQLLGQLRASGFVRARGGGDIRDLNTNSENWAVVKAALCAGAYPSLIRVDKSSRTKLVSQNAGKVMIHASSVIPKLERELDILPSDWLFYEEMTRSGMAACVRCCTLVSALTVAIFAGPSKLPGDALQDAPMDVEPNSGFHGDTSDSENDDPEDNKLSTLQLGDWLSFKNDAEATALALQLRQKWHCLFLRRMRAPSRAWSQMDEAVINALVNVLTNEEQALGLQQPAGIGQRPRPMSAESILTGGYSQKGASNMSHGGDMGMMDDYPDRQRFSTSAKKATSTPPKRKDFLSPKLVQSGSDSSTTSPSGASHQGSHSSTPCGSPQMGPGDTGPCRYFIMKCNSQRNIDMSVSKGAWATSKTNEKKLNKAFQEGKTVNLIFSVQGSGHFQGVAKMSSIIGTDRSSDFNGQGGVFSVDWVKRGNMQFQATHHLLNPWNDHKRVQVSRDGQELEPSVGEALVRLWDHCPDNSGDAKEDPTPARWAHGNQYNQSYTRSPGRNSQNWRHGGRNDRYQGDYESKGYYQDNHSGYYDDSQSNYDNYGGWSGGWTGYQKGNQQQTQRHYNRGQGYINYNSQYAGYQGQQQQQQHEYQPRGSYQHGNHVDVAQQHRKSPVMILQRDGSKQKK